MAADVRYLASGGARAAAVVSADAGFFGLVADRVELVPDVQPCRPGRFCLRELPPLRAALDGLTGMTLLVAGGFAGLDPDGRPGPGAHVHAGFAVPVIGVAKSALRAAARAVPVLRGTLARPLYVTAAGMPRTDAAGLVGRMAGRHRRPGALGRAGYPRPQRAASGAVTLTCPAHHGHNRQQRASAVAHGPAAVPDARSRAASVIRPGPRWPA